MKRRRLLLPTRLDRYQQYSRDDVHSIFDPLSSFTPQTGTWGLQGVVRVPDRPGDWVFFVTFGRQEGHHTFKEDVSRDGVLAWQSQPQQTLESAAVQEWISQDYLKNNVHLFLRVHSGAPYWYLGKLAYVDHDETRERPVYFNWQILDWDPPEEIATSLGMATGPTPWAPPIVTEPSPPPKADKVYGKTSASRSFAARRHDYLADARENAALGKFGEEWVIALEHHALRGRPDLLGFIDHVAKREGDGAGYDIKSVHMDGRPKLIEVKTTRGGAATPWFMTPHELRVSEENPESYYLYRLFDVDEASGTAKFFILKGDVGKQLLLTPTAYRVSMGPPSTR